jgi:hypothetical protein
VDVYAERMTSRTDVLLLCDKASVIASGGRYLLASGMGLHTPFPLLLLICTLQLPT